MKLITKSTISLTISLLSIMGLFSQDIIGSWKGTLKAQGVNLEVVFHIKKQDPGYTSLMDSPTQGAFDIPTTKTTYSNGKLEIVVSNLAVFYQGSFNNDTIIGTFNQGGIPFPLVLTRTEKKNYCVRKNPKHLILMK